ncbi:MAG: hypothetical protein ACI9DC_001259 [Gammaproteobacteria bacterium]|jgi:hypothetical protein
MFPKKVSDTSAPGAQEAAVDILAETRARRCVNDTAVVLSVFDEIE